MTITGANGSIATNGDAKATVATNKGGVAHADIGAATTTS